MGSAFSLGKLAFSSSSNHLTRHASRTSQQLLFSVCAFRFHGRDVAQVVCFVCIRPVLVVNEAPWLGYIGVYILLSVESWLHMVCEFRPVLRGRGGAGAGAGFRLLTSSSMVTSIGTLPGSCRACVFNELDLLTSSLFWILDFHVLYVTPSIVRLPTLKGLTIAWGAGPWECLGDQVLAVVWSVVLSRRLADS